MCGSFFQNEVFRRISMRFGDEGLTSNGPVSHLLGAGIARPVDLLVESRQSDMTHHDGAACERHDAGDGEHHHQVLDRIHDVVAVEFVHHVPEDDDEVRQGQAGW